MICIDTNVLIWGVQGVSRPDQEVMIGRTQRYLRQLSRDNERVMVPSVVVGEYLQGFPDNEHDAQLGVLSANFFLPPYDARCASLAAQLQSAGQPSHGQAGVRITFKSDVQIIATAICHGATKIVTANHDEYRRIAGNRILVSDVPDVWEQRDLLGDTTPE